MTILIFTTKAEALKKFEDLYLNQPNDIYNMYFIKASSSYVLRKEARSNG
jgi:hypothetical protein